ncbi:TetR/AcrR family transcriptional regulator [Streptomyces coelicoflavus]|uniref:TetR/AcrR family transcriptional regulator n=1 Tax=Streptomyces coelicoflavus TaxID=285562 RepID=UPI00368ED1CC
MPKVTQAHLDARRRQIVDAATAAFAERGFARTSMADIVRATGLSTGAVYRYFPSKEHLVLAVVAGRDGQQETGGFPPESAAELLRRLIGYVTPPEGMEHARLVSLIWGDASVTPHLATVARERHDALQRHLTSVLDVRRMPGSEYGPEPEGSGAVAQVALASLIGYAALVATDTPVDTEGFLRVLGRMVSEGCEPVTGSTHAEEAPPP